MKKLILPLLLSLSTSAYSADCDVKFNKQQLDTMRVAYYVGEPDGLGYTLAAISWRETLAGEGLVNYSSNLKNVSAGAFQNKLETVGSREKCQTQKCYGNIAVQLMTDREYAGQAALAEMKDWLKYHKGDLRKSLASYNSGYKHYPVSIKYSADVVNKTNYLKRCVNLKEGDLVFKTPDLVLTKHQKYLDEFVGVHYDD